MHLYEYDTFAIHMQIALEEKATVLAERNETAYTQATYYFFVFLLRGQFRFSFSSRWCMSVTMLKEHSLIHYSYLFFASQKNEISKSKTSRQTHNRNRWKLVATPVLTVPVCMSILSLPHLLLYACVAAGGAFHLNTRAGDEGVQGILKLLIIMNC